MSGAEIGTLRKVDQKYLESFEMWCWRRMEKVSSACLVRNEEVLQRVKEKKNVYIYIYIYIYIYFKEGRVNGLMASCLGTVS